MFSSATSGVMATTGTGPGSSIGQTPPGGRNPKSEYDDVPGENETLIPLRKPTAQHKSSPGNRLFPSNVFRELFSSGSRAHCNRDSKCSSNAKSIELLCPLKTKFARSYFIDYSYLK